MKTRTPDLLMRSLMFVPAHNDKLLDSAARSNADVLLLDLEDSVQPASNKEAARQNILSRIEKGQFAKHVVFPRINDRESGHLLKDVSALSIDGVQGFMYPKAHTGQDIYFIDKLLETIEYEKGYPVGHFKLIPIIETAAAVLNAQDICKASQRVVALAFGCEDFITDLGGIHDPAGQSIFTARALIATAARAHGVVPIDTVHINVHDLPELEQNLVLARKLGYEGMLVLNPKELPLVHQYFSPTEAEVADAKDTIALFETAQSEGQGVVIKNGKFIGPPIVAKARKIVDKQVIIDKKAHV